MSKIKNFGALMTLAKSLINFNHYSRDIEAAKAEGPDREREVIGHAAHLWAADVFRRLRCEIEVTGQENIPAEDGFVIISNHQGYLDIPAILTAFGNRQIGFVAKDNLEKVPLLGNWVRHLRGIFIKRGDAREALRSMKDGVKLVKEGYNLVIFPEGTRSRGPVPGDFKQGSFRLGIQAKAPLVPVAVSGTYHVYEETGSFRPAKVKVVIGKPVETKDLSRQEIRALDQQIEERIKTKVAELSAEDHQYQ